MLRGGFAGKSSTSAPPSKILSLILIVGSGCSLTPESAISTWALKAACISGAIFSLCGRVPAAGAARYRHYPGLPDGQYDRRRSGLRSACHEGVSPISTGLRRHHYAQLRGHLTDGLSAEQPLVGPQRSTRDAPRTGQRHAPKLPLALSRASTAIFIAFAVYAFVFFLTFRTTFGFKLRHVADNPQFCEAVGIRSS